MRQIGLEKLNWQRWKDRALRAAVVIVMAAAVASTLAHLRPRDQANASEARPTLVTESERGNPRDRGRRSQRASPRT